MRTIIAGSRGITDYKVVLAAIRKAIEREQITPTEILSGGAIGVDSLGEKFAHEFGMHVEYHLPDWDKYNKRAGLVRNEEMAKVADALIAIWDGKSRGTAHMIKIAQTHGVKTYVHKI